MTSFDPTESTAGNGVPAKKSKARRGSADKMSRPMDESVCSPEQADERQRQMRALIQLGKQQGFLTHAEINDHLPGNFAQTSAIETIVSTFRDMGVAVYEEAPDSETLLLNDSAPTAVSDEQSDEEAEVTLATVDSEFGRTTDPVRMYMREMGSTELLTRAGEIEIAKRIEDGLGEMIKAAFACPSTVITLLTTVDKIVAGELRIDELVDGFKDTTLDEDAVAADADTDAELDEAELASESDDEDGETEDEQATRANATRLKHLLRDCLPIFANVRDHFDAVPRGLYRRRFAYRRLAKRAGTYPARTGDHPLYRSYHRPVVRRGSGAGRAGSRYRAPHPEDRRRSSRACRARSSWKCSRVTRRISSGPRVTPRRRARTARRLNAACRPFRPNSKS